MTLQEIERELRQAEMAAWHEAEEDVASTDALDHAQVASLLYAAATLLRRAMVIKAAAEALEPAAA